MEEINVLDSNEQKSFFLYGNRALYCLAVNMALFQIISLVLDHLEESSFLGNYKAPLICCLLIIMAVVNTGGCYFAVQGIIKKENKRWRSQLGLLGNACLGLILLFIFILATLPERESEPAQEPIPLEVIE